MPFDFERLPLKDAYIVHAKKFFDDRGFFSELFREDLFTEAGIKFRPVQINLSYSRKGVIRGLHFQRKPFTQAKLIYCPKGKIYDVIVDLRPNSPTFKKWYGVLLSPDNLNALFVPRGFAHGFASLEEGSQVLYATDNVYSKDHDGGIRWNDPDLGIVWPFKDPILSEKDKKLPFLKEIEDDLSDYW